MIKKFGFLTILLIAITLLSCGGDSGLDLKEGKWRMTIEMKIPGMPNPMKPMTVTECITKDNAVPGQTSNQQGCEMMSTKTSGNTVYWEQKCDASRGGGTSKGQITYHYDSFEGYVTMEGQGQTMKSIMKGKWIGSCN